MVTRGRLERIQRQMALVLPDRCDIERTVRTQEPEFGNWTETRQVVAWDVPCRLASTGMDERSTAGRVGVVTTHVVTLPATVDIQSNDTILLDGHRYDVSEIDSRSIQIVHRVYVVHNDEPEHS